MTKKIREQKNTTENKNIIASIFKALLTAFIITSVVFVIYAVLITYTNTSENSMQPVVTITTVVSVLTAGIIVSSGAEKSGWLYGMLTGIMYSAIMILVGFMMSPQISLSLKTLSTILLSAAGGGIGGMIGINIAKR